MSALIELKARLEAAASAGKPARSVVMSSGALARSRQVYRDATGIAAPSALEMLGVPVTLNPRFEVPMLVFGDAGESQPQDRDRSIMLLQRTRSRIEALTRQGTRPFEACMSQETWEGLRKAHAAAACMRTADLRGLDVLGLRLRIDATVTGVRLRHSTGEEFVRDHNSSLER